MILILKKLACNVMSLLFFLIAKKILTVHIQVPNTSSLKCSDYNKNKISYKSNKKNGIQNNDKIILVFSNPIKRIVF